MPGQRARTTSSPSAPEPTGPQESATGHQGAKHSRRKKLMGRLRRRLLAYREVEFLSSHIPGDPGPGKECLLLVHIRKVIGQVHYRICTHCAEAVITDIHIEERFLATGLGTRALSHLRSRHPGMTWRSTLSLRTTRDLLRRMRIPPTAVDRQCSHTSQPVAQSSPSAR
ncbi:hypothetical protein [Streptomyces sp. G-G2]|uniref:hypothetical protein n=1 Tax=Streptomyces sp. G-G2 TaxID=3046201 RepID=UPI0024BB5E58|nr:hypothetical protein [Streptomyces sp. G-G2]MDJ0385968.1 hypothetical protein [Streptomyces sp. G-G2]